MKLSYLIKNCSPVWRRVIEPDLSRLSMGDEILFNHDPEITSIHSNASEVKPGGLFIAIKGFKTDGHNYIGRAISNGAVAIITEQKIGKTEIAESVTPDMVSSEILSNFSTQKLVSPPVNTDNHLISMPIVVEVQDTRKAMSSIAARFYGNPSDNITLIGITGTNGKTTTAFLIESILKAAGCKTGVIGTVNYRYNDQIFENPVTTPESIDLHKILALMKDAGVTHVVMEVSSHAIDLHRVRDCEFDVGVFTNLTQDHLDYHKTMPAYFACKKSFFTKQLKKGKKGKKSVAVINVNDSYGRQLTESGLEIRTITVGTDIPTNSSHTFNNIWSSSIKDNISGLKGNLHINSEGDTDSFITFESKLTGSFNLENILCAVGAAYAIGISPEIIKNGIESCNGVPGRLERVEVPALERVENLYSRDGFNRYVFVDYAHTPDALESILKTLKMRAPARLISIFGCGGDRDKTKRPIMGEIACRYSDITIITSDNPRSENPDTIISEIIKGIPERDPQKIIVEPDRAKALEIAVNISEPNDIIVAAGKGHETYQITAQGKIDFDDRVILRDALSKLSCQKASSSQKPISWSVADILNALEISKCGSREISEYDSRKISEFGSGKISECSSSFEEITFTSVSTDSRTITKDELFVALKGERFDGHTFIFDLINRGVRGFVVEKGFYELLTSPNLSAYSPAMPPLYLELCKNIGELKSHLEKPICFFPVDDTLTALGMLARFQRVRSRVKVVAITGSNGKTTTRKMTASIFEQHFKTLSTQGNLNNEIGVPLTLLKLSKEHEWAVIEMGMNHPGEISRLSKIACPDIAIITNTTDAHLEGLGTVEDVARAKAEIVEGMNQGSTIIINRDDPRWQIIAEQADKFPNISNKIFFGLGKISHFSAQDTAFNQDGISFSLCINLNQETKYCGLQIKTPARFMLQNAIAASAAAFAAEIPESSIRKGLLAFEPASGRMKIIDFPLSLSNPLQWLHIIDDTYNANPGSVKAAIETLKNLSSQNSHLNKVGESIDDGEAIAVLGDMLELGEKSPQLHFEIGQEVVKSGISRLYAYGDMALEIVKGAKEAIKICKTALLESNIFHGTKEEIIEALLQYMKRVEKTLQNNNLQEIEKTEKTGNKKMQKGEANIWILIKGSRGMKMEIVVQALMKQLNN
ncbi:MAG: UDP-N-acetylmuramoyl-L-alanyl-D-glutamate--2,6-diaminopimelate ligase [Desulfamplus sp.]|nr:UDP-N-acetylmuramoyl-L-alanyl-D-glutamate--2,6-diaminopimelate ligase [Desulfamplus sp.]